MIGVGNKTVGIDPNTIKIGLRDDINNELGISDVVQAVYNELVIDMYYTCPYNQSYKK